MRFEWRVRIALAVALLVSIVAGKGYLPDVYLALAMGLSCFILQWAVIGWILEGALTDRNNR